MKKLILSALMATALFATPVFADTTPLEIFHSIYGDFDAHGQLVTANKTALQKMDFKAVQKKAEQGDKDAQFYLAKMYDTGIHTEQDTQRAMEWYKKSAENGNALAMNDYAQYLNDLNPSAESVYSDEALDWLKKASALNQPHATMWLAIHHIEKGQDIEKNEKILLTLSENGFALADLALYFSFGQAILKSDTVDEEVKNKIQNQRLEFLKKSAKSGYAPAQMMLSDHYQINDVRSVEISVRPMGIINAYKWAKKACNNGVERGCQRVESLGEFKEVDLNEMKSECEKGEQSACEAYKMSKFVQDEMNKLDK